MIIAIDGPAGTGKTTVARRVAERLGFQYFDTGAMYRAVTYLLLKKNISCKDEERILSCLEDFQFVIRVESNQKRYFVNTEDVTEAIRSKEVTRKVSEVAALPSIRQALVSIQRKFAEKGDAVFEGRDMGTVVFPDAELKIFLTARPTIRAERRYLEVKDKMEGMSKEEVLREIMERDRLDSSREASPLKQAEDAQLIDTSDLTINEVVERIISLIRR